MHPFIKIICLFVIIGMLVALSPERVIIIAVSLFLLIALKGRHYWQDVWRMCWRMKWLWFSLLVLYGWFIPGSPVIFSDTIPLVLIPSSEGLVIGILRALVLLNIVTAVVLIIKSTSKEALIVSIMWLITPFKLFKIDTGVFAARLVLTMERVTEKESEIKKSLQAKQKTGSFVQRGIDTVAGLLIDVEQQARKTPDISVSLPYIKMPAPTQWLIPIVLFVILYLI